MFKFWLPRAEACGDKLNYLQTNGGREFISAVFQSFCKEQGIKIGYTASYIHKENGIVEQC